MNPQMINNQMNQNMLEEKQSNIPQDNIDLIIKCFDGTKIFLNISNNEKISTLKTILYTKYNIDPSTELLYKKPLIDGSRTLSDYKIRNNCIISIMPRLTGGEVGSCAKQLADPTKKAPVEWPTTHDGPFYLIVKNGINIFGFCQNKECEAYKKEVCSPFGYGAFDLIEDLTSKSKKCPKCPACEYYLLEIESCGFMNCEYHYEGKKYENKELIDVDFRKKTTGGYKAIDYIDPGKKGENKSTWVELKISATKLSS